MKNLTKYFLLSAFVIALPAGVCTLAQGEEGAADLSSHGNTNFLNPKSTYIAKPKVAAPVAKPAPPIAKTTAPTTAVAKPVKPNGKPAEPKLEIQAPEIVKNVFIASCNCEFPGEEPRSVNYEDEKACASDRKYMSASLKKMPEWMREVRENFPEAKIARECVAYVMRTSLMSPKVRISSLARCANSKGIPVKGNKTQCVTEPYVNSVYNALVDVSDCLNIPQADLIAKLANESGLHINAVGSQFDAGIGQLTSDAINTVIQPYWSENGRMIFIDYFVDEMGKSDKASCKRILSQPSTFAKVGPNNRCTLMNPPENPYRNVLYTGLYYRDIIHKVAGIHYKSGEDLVENKEGTFPMPATQDFVPGGAMEDFNIRKNLIALGIKNPDMKAVQRSLVILGYNSGPGKGPLYLNEYLKKRLQEKLMLKSEDVDFLQTDFTVKYQKMISSYFKNGKANAALAQAAKTAHRKSFPEFLMLVTRSGAPGYLTAIAKKHKLLLEKMGDERCVSPNFIHY